MRQKLVGARRRASWQITDRQTFSPSRSSATGNAATRATAGCRIARSSICAGWMLWPPRMIRSFLRPTISRLPLRVEAAEIAAHEPAVAVERILGRLLVVEIAEHQQAPRPPISPTSPGRDLAVGILLVPQPDFVGAARPPAGRDDGFGVVVRQRVLVRAVLGHAVDVLRLDALRRETPAPPRRDRRAGHVEHLDRAERSSAAPPHSRRECPSRASARPSHRSRRVSIDPVERRLAGRRVVDDQLQPATSACASATRCRCGGSAG